MRRRRRLAVASLIVSLAALVTACNSERPAGQVAVYPVKGQVLFGGKPVAGALVTFHPVDESKTGAAVVRPTGQTDDDGRFELMSYTRGDGAPAGSYLVSIAGLARPSSEGSVLPDPKRPPPKTDVLKGRFLDHKKNNLKAEVKEGENVVPAFDLK
ncbi:MAG: hypothetical protein P4L84_13220 [Isosphaeraceae bacterium]|nr:hypothetical protein [Isosphaeraceae bacterium]